MVLKILAATYNYWPTQYTPHAVVSIIAILTGAFAPLGLVLLEALVQRGAHVIVLTTDEVEEERVTMYVDLVRSTTSFENVFAEEYDLRDPGSVKAFAAKFVTMPKVPTAPPWRLDALGCAHEYAGVGALGAFASSGGSWSSGNDLLTTLLPSLLTVECDIRIALVVNRWYAAALRFSAGNAYEFPSFPPSLSSSGVPEAMGGKTKNAPTLLGEASRALRTVLLTRHLQRILDTLSSMLIPVSLDSADKI